MDRDIVIVGGGPAGLTTALALAHAAPRLAARVVVLEKGTYPRDKYCAGAVGARGERFLEELDAVPDVPSARVDGISFRAVEGETVARVPRIGRVVRRIEFDHALARVAASRGIELRDGVRVDGIEGRAVKTSRGEIAASVVVGADGVGSVVRKALGVEAGVMRAQVLELDTEPVAGDRDRALLHFDAADRRFDGYYWDFPTVVGKEDLVCRGVYRLKVYSDHGVGPENEIDIQTLLGERLREMGLDIARYKNKRYAERGYDPIDRVVGGRLMLVGEAAGIDPVTGEGIAQALEYGALAGRFLARAFAHVDGNDAALEHELRAWDHELKTSRLSRDLRIRRGFVGMFYGAPRAEVERFILDCPEFLYVGCQHFGAQPYDKAKLARVFARGAVKWLSLKLASA